MKYVFTTISFLFITLGCFSQIFKGLSLSDGLSDLVINALYKSSDGYLWIGTSSSLDRFDGTYIKHYYVPTPDEKMKEVNVIVGMPENEVWMGNSSGLWRVNGDKLERVLPDKIKNKVYSLLHDGKGKLYIGTEVGLYIYDKGVVEYVLVDPNVVSAANHITGMTLDGKGKLWLATHRGLYSMTLANKHIDGYKYDKSLARAYYNICLVGSVLYLGTREDGIVTFDLQSLQFSFYMNLGCITSLSCNADGTLYVSTNGNGIYFISTVTNKITKRIFHEPNNNEGLRSNSVYSLLVDKEGIIWAGLFQLGLDYSVYQYNVFTTYQFPPDFESKNLPVRTIEIGAKDKLIGTRDGLFYVDESRGIYKKFESYELRSNMIMCSYSLQGKYYIGTYGGGMYVFDPKNLTLSDFDLTQPLPFVHGQIFSITADYLNNLWMGTSEGVFCYKEDKQIYRYTSANSRLPEGNVYGIYFDSTHRGWICTENGICMIDPLGKRVITDKFPEGFINRKLIRAIYEDTRHNLYFLPDKGGLFVSDLSLNNFSALSGTPFDKRSLMFMIEDSEGWLWIGTNDGLFRYDRKSTFTSYTFADGIPSQIFFNCIPKRDKAEVLWFGNSKGLIYTDTNRINAGKEYPYSVCISDIETSEGHLVSPILSDKGRYAILLEPDNEEVTIHFSAFTYTDPTYMMFEYYLEGKDKSWQMLKGASKVTIHGLSSGEHTFRVRRAGDTSSEVVLLIRMPFSLWRTWWGLSLVVLLIGLCLYGLYLWRLKRKVLTVNQFLSAPEETVLKEKKKLTDPITDDKYKSSNITAEDCKQLTERLKDLIREKKLYKKPELKIGDLAKELNIPAYILSYLFNQYLKKNYYDYINDYRIAEFKLLVNNGEHNTYTLNALIEKCGFNSRASFFRYFKKSTGMTPNEYIKGLKGSV